MRKFIVSVLTVVAVVCACVGFTACGKEKGAKVTFDTVGGNTIEAMNIAKGDNYELPTPLKAGYEFKGWYDKSSETGDDVTKFKFKKKVESTGVWDSEDDVDLYARWSAKSYTVTLNLDGGTGDTSATAKFGSKFNKTPTKTGYTFNGWKYNGISKGKTFTWDIDADSITLIAEWLANDQTVTLNLDGGTGIAKTTETVKYDSTYTLPTTVPTKVGYTFLGWYDAQDNKVETSILVQKNITLKAKWEVKNLTVSIDANGGSIANGLSQSVSLDFGTAPDLTAYEGNVTREGYTFRGWTFNDAKVDENFVLNEEPVTHAFVAIWEANSQTVTLDLNGGTGIDTTIDTEYDATLTLPTNLTKVGYNFVGWLDGENNPVSSSLTVKGNYSFKANWTAKTYTVTLNAGTLGNVANSTVTVTYDAIPTDKPIAVPTDAQSDVFDGWYYMDGESKVEVDFNAVWKIDNDDLTLTANWVGVATTLTYVDEEGNTIATVNTNVRKQLNLLTAEEETSIAKVGYDITWEVVGSTVVYDAGELFTVSAPGMSLKIKYVAKKYTVTVISYGAGAEYNGTKFVNNKCEIEVTYNGACNFSSLNAGTIADWSFDKFVLVVNGEVTENGFDLNQTTWTTDSNVTIFALYEDGKGNYSKLV